MRVEYDGGQRGQNPRPGPDGVVGNVEPEHRQQAVPLVARAEDTLCNVPAAAGLRARIPERPPLQSQEHHESEGGQGPESFGGEGARKVRKECSGIGRAGNGSARGREFVEHGVHASASCDCIPRNPDYDRHLEGELKQVGPQHAPKAAERNVQAGKGDQEKYADQKSFVVVDAERRGNDRRHRLRHPAEDQAVHQ